MTAKEYLMQYRAISAKVRMLQNEIERLRTEAESASISIDGLPKGGKGGSKMENIVVQLADFETSLQDELSQVWRTRMQIIDKLSQIKDVRHYEILRLRYLEGERWEQIAVDMNITWRHCYRLHGSALAEFEKILKKDS